MYTLLQAIPRLNNLSNKTATANGFKLNVGRSLCGETVLIASGLLGTALPAVIEVQIDISITFNKAAQGCTSASKVKAYIPPPHCVPSHVNSFAGLPGVH